MQEMHIANITLRICNHDDIVDSRHSEADFFSEPENKNDIVGNKTLHCGKLMDMFKKFYKEHGQNEPRCKLLCNWNTVNILHLSLEPPHVNNSRFQCTL
jgi:hypothetical protein